MGIVRRTLIDLLYLEDLGSQREGKQKEDSNAVASMPTPKRDLRLADSSATACLRHDAHQDQE